MTGILLVLDADDNNAILKTYIHANNQIIMQHNGNHTGSKYFYLHDRLGSVRQMNIALYIDFSCVGQATEVCSLEVQNKSL